MSSCSIETVIGSSVITFNGGETKLVSVSYPLAPDTCPGSMSVTVSAYSGSTMLATDSAVLTIQ
jgi:hypothetical protein